MTLKLKTFVDFNLFKFTLVKTIKKIYLNQKVARVYIYIYVCKAELVLSPVSNGKKKKKLFWFSLGTMEIPYVTLPQQLYSGANNVFQSRKW